MLSYDVSVEMIDVLGVDIVGDIVDNDACLHRAHLNSSFFLTLVRPTQTR
jgi:hypothetical protein